MTITFDFDIDDMMAFQENFLTNSKYLKKAEIFVALLLPVMLMMLFLYYWTHKEMSPILIGIGIFFVIVAIMWVRIIKKKFIKNVLARTRKILLENEKDNSIVFGIMEMTFDEKGIFVKTPKTESLTKWIAVLKVVKDLNYYYLYFSRMTAFVIPIQKIGDSKKELDTIINEYVANIIQV